MNPNVKIGQAVVSCVALNERNNELEFTWVQFGRGFESLVGQCFEYTNMLSKSEIRLGDRSRGDKQDIVFDPCFCKELMKDDREYAVLVRWNPASKDTPEILGFGSKSNFDSTVEALKTRKDTFVPSVHRQEEAPKKSNFKFDVVREEEDPTFYKVTAFGRKAAGKVNDVFLRMTHLAEDDPTQMLLLGVWEKKGDDNRYTRCECPNLPEPNDTLVNAYRKKNLKRQA